MTTPVSFEIAKLLKEKKIKIDTEEVLFYRDEINNIEEHQIKNRDVLYNYTGFGDYITDENEYQTYRIAEVVMWLYEKHGIFVTVTIPYSQFGKFSAEIWGKESDNIKILLVDGMSVFNTINQAYEEGIIESLKLI